MFYTAVYIEINLPLPTHLVIFILASFLVEMEHWEAKKKKAEVERRRKEKAPFGGGMKEYYHTPIKHQTRREGGINKVVCSPR